MTPSAYGEAVKKACCALDLERRIVGVRFLFSSAEFDRTETQKPASRMTYCRMVTRAAKGEAMKADQNNFGCFAAARVLGIVEMDDWYTSGHYYGNCGLYQDLPTAKEITDHMPVCGHKAYGLEIKPLEDFRVDPHIVIVISTPVQLMRLVQGYSYVYGTHAAYRFIGNQAMCAECTAYPYQTNDINFSVLCAGARRSGLADTEAAIGIPLTKFIAMIDGVCRTITPVESNPRKQVIQNRLAEHRISDVDIRFNISYGDAMRKHDTTFFLNRTDPG